MRQFVLTLLFVMVCSPVLFSQAIPRLSIQTSHSSAVNQIVYSHNGEWIASASEDKTIKIWSNRTGKLIQTIDNFGYVAKALAFHPRMNLLAATAGSKIYFWNIKDGTVIAELDGHRDEIYSIDFNGDGNLLASGGMDETIIIWNVRKRKKIKRLRERIPYTNTIYSVVMTDDGEYVFAAGEDIYIKKWDWRRRKIVDKLPMHPNRINSLALNRYNTLLASASNDRSIKVWNVMTGDLLVTLENFDSPVEEATFHPSSDRLLAAYYMGINDTANNFISNQSIGRIANLDYDNTTIEWHFKNNQGVLDLAVNPHDNTVLVAGVDRTIRQYSINNGNFYKELGASTHINDIEYIPENNQLLVAGDDGYVKIWDMSRGLISGIIDTKVNGTVTAISYNQHTGQLVTAVESIVQFWKYDETNQRFREISSFDVPEGRINDICFAKNRRNLVISRSQKISVISNEELLEVFNGGIIPEEMRIYYDSTYIEIWNPYKGHLLACIENRNTNWLPLTMHPEKNTLLFSRNDEGIVECDLDNDYNRNNLINMNNQDFDLVEGLASGATASVVKGKKDNVNVLNNNMITSMTYSSDGRYMAYGGDDNQIYIWDAISDKVRPVGQFSDAVTDIAFSPTTNFIATTSANKAQIWDFTSGKLLHEYTAGQKLNHVTFGKNENQLITAGENDAVRLWDIDTEQQMAHFITVGLEDYITVIDGLYYRSSLHGTNGVGVYYRGRSYPLEQLALKYNRPALVMERLDATNQTEINAYQTIHQKRLAEKEMTEDVVQTEFHLPDLEILEKELLRTSTRHRSYVFSVQATDSKFDLKRLHVTINGVPVYGPEGFDIDKYNTDRFQHTFRINLEQGQNIIQVSCENKRGIESLKKTLEVFYNADDDDYIEPDLYVVAVGLDNYENTEETFSTPSTDVSALSKYFASLTDNYANIYIDTIYNNDATLENIRAASHKFKESRVDDDVVFIFSGRSVLDSEMNYWLAPYEANFSSPQQNCLIIDSLVSLFSGVEARNRSLLLDLHTQCNKPCAELIIIEELTKDINRLTGANIFASRSAEEFVFEREQQKHGLMTYNFLRAISGAAADSNSDGKLNFSELGKYLQSETQRLSVGKQNILVRIDEMSKEFLIW